MRRQRPLHAVQSVAVCSPTPWSCSVGTTSASLVLLAPCAKLGQIFVRYVACSAVGRPTSVMLQQMLCLGRLLRCQSHRDRTSPKWSLHLQRHGPVVKAGLHRAHLASAHRHGSRASTESLEVAAALQVPACRLSSPAGCQLTCGLTLEAAPAAARPPSPTSRLRRW